MTDKVHTNPILCFDVPIGVIEDWKQIKKLMVTMSTNINEVTCDKCIYYYTHPEAREMERKFRLAKMYG